MRIMRQLTLLTVFPSVNGIHYQNILPTYTFFCYDIQIIHTSSKKAHLSYRQREGYGSFLRKKTPITICTLEHSTHDSELCRSVRIYYWSCNFPLSAHDLLSRRSVCLSICRNIQINFHAPIGALIKSYWFQIRITYDSSYYPSVEVFGSKLIYQKITLSVLPLEAFILYNNFYT